MIKKEVIATRVTEQIRNDISQYIIETGRCLNESDFLRQAIREKLYWKLRENEIRLIVRDELQTFKETETEND